MKFKERKYKLLATACLVLILGVGLSYFLTSMNKEEGTFYLYIDNDDNVDSVLTKLSAQCSSCAMSGFSTIVRHSSYEENIHTGRYAIKPGECAITVYRHLSNGMQSPVHLTIPSVRTMDRLAAELSKRLMLDSAQLQQAFTDETLCQQYGYDTATIACMFIPNTYDIYWNVSLEKLLGRMQTESKKFWSGEREQKAKAADLTEEEVITLASIVDEETANNAEKPMVAGMYINRLRLRNTEYPNGMPLQADPTIKFAWKQFDLKRIYNKLLTIDSPYNTYKNTGLPPGPIRIPTIAGIDAVLNYAHHDYLYMCAKEDLSGTHNFAVTYQDHLKNAKRYTEALNQRGIK